MKIILLQDVSKVGRKGEVKEVSPGFGRNFLISRGKAVLATPAALTEIEQKTCKKIHDQELENQILEKISGVLVQEPLVIKAKASPEGHLFAGVHAEQISELISKKYNLTFEPNWLKLEKPLKEVGEFQIEIERGKFKSTFTVRIENL